MDCTQAQKVRYGTHMLAVEADDWWLETHQRLEVASEEITWIVFRREFLRKYYPEDVRVTEYTAKFTELAKFYPYYEGAGAEFSKCIKIYEEDHNAHYKLVKDRRGKQNRSTPYDALVGKGKAEVANGKKTSGGGAPAS
ncbi:uncharacterized protein LOC131618727 [Vicia villosa]|uniref:uncharacterized protein LOC131618727 n=1 Tax=Vicia villosa TaxID=3911 RepID=UPI00273C27A7|nr:uncharacterized protein LOC131618727 [Vicia villosa]